MGPEFGSGQQNPASTRQGSVFPHGRALRMRMGLIFLPWPALVQPAVSRALPAQGLMADRSRSAINGIRYSSFSSPGRLACSGRLSQNEVSMVTTEPSATALMVLSSVKMVCWRR